MTADRPSDEPRWRRHPGVLFRSTLGGAVVLAPSATQPQLLSAPATALWASLERPVTTEDLVRSFAHEHGQLEPHIRRLLGELTDAGLVVAC